MFDTAWQAGAAGHWDVAWLFSTWQHGGLSVVPAVNMVSNLGFDPDATHTRDGRSVFAALPACAAAFPLHHPPAIARSEEEERLAASRVFSGNLNRLMQRLHTRVHAEAR